MGVCPGQCPGFKSLDLWELSNTVRREMDLEEAIVHPRLCVDDGAKFIKNYIQIMKAFISSEPVSPGCRRR